MINKVGLLSQIDLFIAEVLGEEVCQKLATHVDTCVCIPDWHSGEERKNGREREA